MSVKTTHPQYNDLLDIWELCRDSFQGERTIKAEGTKYLPPTSGQLADGLGKSSQSIGAAAYNAYIMRAVYPDNFAQSIIKNVGVMHKYEPTIELPAQLEGMREVATADGLSLTALLRRINIAQLTTGRIGLLADITTTKEIKPIIQVYNELSIRNWNLVSGSGLSVLVLDESEMVLDAGLNWVPVEQYKVLRLLKDADPNDADGVVNGGDAVNVDDGVYGFADLKAGDSALGAEYTLPNYMGNTLDKIPFTIINAQDLDAAASNPPLLGLAELCLAIYRGEADYRQNLYMQGQDTLVTIGLNVDDDEQIRTGAGARIDIPTISGDAKYIGVSSQGLAEQRMCLESDRALAADKSGQLDATGESNQQSGEALKIRSAAQTATLTQIAIVGAAGLEQSLRHLAEWIGANPDEVRIMPNLDFIVDDIGSADLLNLIKSKNLGAPLSAQSIHAWMMERKITRVNFEDEMGAIGTESPML